MFKVLLLFYLLVFCVLFRLVVRTKTRSEEPFETSFTFTARNTLWTEELSHEFSMVSPVPVSRRKRGAEFVASGAAILKLISIFSAGWRHWSSFEWSDVTVLCVSFLTGKIILYRSHSNLLIATLNHLNDYTKNTLLLRFNKNKLFFSHILSTIARQSVFSHRLLFYIPC